MNNSIEKEDVINALKVLATMLKHAKLSTHDVAELMIKQLGMVDFVPATSTQQKLEEVIKFNKSFEALYNISMKMADECIVNKSPEHRIEKLDEEYKELTEALNAFRLNQQSKVHPSNTWAINDVVANNLIDEASDVMFVLFHLLYKFNKTPFDLLHIATTKMLSRMNNPDYKAKN